MDVVNALAHERTTSRMLPPPSELDMRSKPVMREIDANLSLDIVLARGLVLIELDLPARAQPMQTNVKL